MEEGLGELVWTCADGDVDSEWRDSVFDGRAYRGSFLKSVLIDLLVSSSSSSSRRFFFDVKHIRFFSSLVFYQNLAAFLSRLRSWE